jgi:hypothetical protein
VAYIAGTTATTGTTSAATARPTATPGGLSAAWCVGASTLAVGSLRLFAGGLRLASKLDRDLALEDLLARKLTNGALSLAGGGEVDEGIANWTVGARVLGNRDRLTRGGGQLISRKEHVPKGKRRSKATADGPWQGQGSLPTQKT